MSKRTYTGTKPDIPFEPLYDLTSDTAPVRTIRTTTEQQPCSMPEIDALVKASEASLVATQGEREKFIYEHAPLIDSAKRSATALREVHQRHTGNMSRLLQATPFFNPLQGHGGSLRQHLDTALDKWKGSYAVLTALDSVESEIDGIAMRPGSERPGRLQPIQRRVKGAEGCGEALEQTVQYILHLVRQIAGTL